MNNESQICFISSPHDSFFCGKVVEFKERYHKSPDEYWQTDCIKPECLKEGWQTSGSKKVVRMAFNLFCGGTPSVDENESVEKQLYECKQYAVDELFCCMYAPFFWEAVKIRYPEYVSYDHELYDLLGGAD